MEAYLITLQEYMKQLPLRKPYKESVLHNLYDTESKHILRVIQTTNVKDKFQNYISKSIELDK